MIVATHRYELGGSCIHLYMKASMHDIMLTVAAGSQAYGRLDRLDNMMELLASAGNSASAQAYSAALGACSRMGEVEDSVALIHHMVTSAASGWRLCLCIMFSA